MENTTTPAGLTIVWSPAPGRNGHVVDPELGYSPYGGITNPLPAIPAAGTTVQVGYRGVTYGPEGRTYGPPTVPYFRAMGTAEVAEDQPRIRRVTDHGHDPLRPRFPGQEAVDVDILVRNPATGAFAYVTVWVRPTGWEA